MKRSGFKRPELKRRPPSPVRRLDRSVHVAVIGLGARAVPKPVEHRNPHLLTLARDQQCLLRVSGTCMGNTETTVACHSNLGIHGKAGARKADDQYSVWGCMACHRWLDQGPADYEEKGAAFMYALARQVLQWKLIAEDKTRAPRDRAAAVWALGLIVDSLPPQVPDITDQKAIP